PGRNSKHTSAGRRNPPARIPRGSSMKYLHVAHLVESFNNRPTLVLTWITLVRRHYTRRRTFRPLNTQLTKPLVMDRFKYRYEICLQSHQDCLRLRVAETHVIFEKLRSIVSQHQTQK